MSALTVTKTIARGSKFIAPIARWLVAFEVLELAYTVSKEVKNYYDRKGGRIW